MVYSTTLIGRTRNLRGNRHPLISQNIGQVSFLDLGISYSRPFAAFTLHHPITISILQSHSTTKIPPMRSVFRQGDPELPFFAEVAEMPQQFSIQIAGTSLNDVIRMDDYVYQSMFANN